MTKAELLQALTGKPVPCEVAGLSVYLRPLSVGERQRFQAAVKDGTPTDKAVVRLFSLSICDEAGRRLFDDSPEAEAQIDALDGRAAEKLTEAILELNGIGEKKA